MGLDLGFLPIYLLFLCFAKILDVFFAFLSCQTPAPTPPPTEQFFCGCPECTAAIWNYNACNNNANPPECFTCGSRISWLQSSDGGLKTEEEACTQVSNEFANDECGPACNPQLCNPGECRVVFGLFLVEFHWSCGSNTVCKYFILLLVVLH